MKSLLIYVFCILLTGCAVTTFELPAPTSEDRIYAIKDSHIERIRARNVLFVNRSSLDCEAAVFLGRYYEDELFGFGPDGLIALKVWPEGVFGVGGAVEDFNDEDGDHNRKLVRFEFPGQEYTVLLTYNIPFGGFAGYDIIQGHVSERPMKEEYCYRKWLGPSAGRVVCEPINDVEILPVFYLPEHRGTNVLLNKTIDANKVANSTIDWLLRFLRLRR